MMKVVKIVMMFFVAILLTSCYNSRSVAYLQNRSSLPDYPQGQFSEYRLQVNDEIVLRVISTDVETANLFQSSPNGNSSQGVSYRIFEDGTVDLPFLSKVPLLGLTLKEAEDSVEHRLQAFAPNSKVKIALATGTFCVIGDAGRGYFPIYKERLTIFQALALCGGISESGKFKSVKIIRTTAEGTKVVNFDVRSESLLGSEFYYIYPNDVIYIDVSKKRFWAINSYSNFLSLITSSLTLLVAVWSTFNK